jgi:hypothetical protein
MFNHQLFPRFCKLRFTTPRLLKIKCGFTARRSLPLTFALKPQLNGCLCHFGLNEQCNRGQGKRLWSTIEHQPAQKTFVFNRYALGLKLGCKQLIIMMVE